MTIEVERRREVLGRAIRMSERLCGGESEARLVIIASEALAQTERRVALEAALVAVMADRLR